MHVHVAYCRLCSGPPPLDRLPRRPPPKELSASDEATSMLFNLDDVKSVELTLDPLDMDVMTNEAPAAQAKPRLV